MLERIKRIIADQLGIDEEKLTPEADLEELGADSLDAVELMVRFEDEFDISIPDDDIVAVRTVGDVAEYLENITL